MSRNIEGSYANYREKMENPDMRTQGMETEGLGPDEFIGAVTDTRSVVLEDKDGFLFPLVVPIEHLPYANQSFLSKAATQSGAPSPDIYYYNHLSALLWEDPDRYLAAMEPLLVKIARGAGVFAVDHVRFDKLVHDRDLQYVARKVGLKISDLLAKNDPPIQHYQYASAMLATEPERLRVKPYELFEGFEAALSRGEVSNDGSIQVLETLSQEDVEYVWGFYSPAFAELDDIDPIISGFNEKDFFSVMASRDFVKIVHRTKDGKIANLALLAKLEHCPWINHAYFRQHFPVQYREGQVIVSPGIIADPSAPGRLSLGTIGMVRKLAELSGGEPVLTFVCDEISNRQVPGLSHAGLNRSNALLTDFLQPRAHQVFRLFRYDESVS